MNMDDPVVIVSAARTPVGWFQGVLSDVPATELGAVAIRGALERSGLAPDSVDTVLMGCVLSAGLGQNPARQAAHGAGLPFGAATATVNKLCGSGMMAIAMGHDALKAGSAQAVVAGGLESMSNAPYLLTRARQGYRLGHGQMIDHMFHDGLEDAYEPGQLMGHFAEQTARDYDFSRLEQDEYAAMTLARARVAVEGGAFAAEISPVSVRTRKGAVEVTQDENPLKAQPDKIPTLRPAFGRDGTITAASSSGIADGAAAVVLARRSWAERQGLPVFAAIRALAVHSQAPRDFTQAPVPAIRKLLDRAGWRVGDVDLFEINEAFAVTAMVAQRDLDIPSDRLNVNGGACALGHPIGATGARLVTTLLHALRARGLRRGVAAACIGGGEAIAIAVELP
ncbi:thiolase family protein [Gluconacetobacter tumulicola]|uniref:Acetyl-CoA C-acyltransferase n=1 Tax=Gluconacetobacter tumulicola TaxID=1017177 RepID=A0A7W4JAT3_9PROT|nr:acetyl-CoA C-acyltransferase [Gluconacetobacter tumulicola]MBB2177771.1 acetyl-CoA C-acyltransferase [Gluconacetobacter tumulicola]